MNFRIIINLWMFLVFLQVTYAFLYAFDVLEFSKFVIVTDQFLLAWLALYIAYLFRKIGQMKEKLDGEDND